MGRLALVPFCYLEEEEEEEEEEKIER